MNFFMKFYIVKIIIISEAGCVPLRSDVVPWFISIVESGLVWGCGSEPLTSIVSD